MSTPGGVRVIWIGDSTAAEQTDTRAVVDAKYSLLSGVPLWLRWRASAIPDVRIRRTIWQPASSLISYPMTYSPLTLSRAWPGALQVCLWKLQSLGHTPHAISVAEGGATLAVDWNPTPGGFRDYAALLSDYSAAIASTAAPADPGAARTVLVVQLGANDALDATQSANFAANMSATVSGIRTAFGLASLKVLLVRLNAACTRTNTATVRTQQATWDASDANGSLIDVDSCALYDGVHYTAAGAEAKGLLIASAIDGVLP